MEIKVIFYYNEVYTTDGVNSIVVKWIYIMRSMLTFGLTSINFFIK